MQSFYGLDLNEMNKYAIWIIILFLMLLNQSCINSKGINLNPFIGLFIQRVGSYSFEYTIKKNGKVIETYRNAETGSQKRIGKWEIINNQTILFRFKDSQEEDVKRYIIQNNCLMIVDDKICLYEKVIK